jgi:hypothetical protein
MGSMRAEVSLVARRKRKAWARYRRRTKAQPEVVRLWPASTGWEMSECVAVAAGGKAGAGIRFMAGEISFLNKGCVSRA